MLSRISTQDITCPVSDQDLMAFVACLDPNQQPMISSLGLAATSAVESYLGDFITQRSIRWVLSRGESEQTASFFDSWLDSRSYVAYGFNTIAGQWIEFPTSAQSVQSVTLGVWGMDDWNLTLGQDYALDLFSDPARMSVTYNLYIEDFYTNFSHMIVDYTGGIAPSGSCPEVIALVIKIMTKKLFDNRDTGTVNLFDSSVEALLTNYRRVGFGQPR